jgi:glycosyltransferase involved in cell wall biosynthesis
LERQDYGTVEHLVMDGGSSDGTIEILDEYQKKYPDKLFYVSEKDTGQSNAINKGFHKATGDIVGWINSDDYYEDNILWFVNNFFADNPSVDMMYGSCNMVDENGVFLNLFEEGYGFGFCKIKDYKVFHRDTLLNVYSGLIPQQTIFFRRKIFKNVGYLDESYDFTMDYEYWLRISAKCQINRVDRVLANFRTHGAAKTNFDNRLSFSREVLRARKNHGGQWLAPIRLYMAYWDFKTIIKALLIKIGIIKIS